MVAIRLQSFGAMLPAVDRNLLPQNNAELSRNTWIYSGAIEGMPEPVSVHTLVNSAAKRVFRIPVVNFGKDNIPDSEWLEFLDADTNIILSPVANDSFERVYWCSPSEVPKYNTTARILDGDPAYLLGVPAPVTAPGGSVAGGAAPVETRAYVYTWVSAYGEEGPPSPPFTLTGNASGTWNMTFTAPGALATDRNLTNTRIYRTITGSSGSTTYYLVAEIAIATLAYADTVPTTTVAASTLLQSLFWSPPTDMDGMVSMPNGMIAGFKGNEVYFCEPYRPHAWPSIYNLSVEGDIVGLGVVGQSLVVCTTRTPYVISGVSPAAMSQSKIASLEPCLSRGSIVSTPGGVLYASQNGLVLVVPGQTRVVTQNIITKDLWLDPQNYLNANRLRATLLGSTYYCWGVIGDGAFEETAFDDDAFLFEDFTGAYLGAIVDFNDERIGYTQLLIAEPHANCWSDEWTGEIMTIRDGQVFWLDLARARPRQPFLWRSKVFDAPNQRNFGAMRTYFELWPDTPTLNPVPNASQSQTLAADQYGLVRVYCDGVLRFTRELRSSGEIMKLPSGFKATYWQIEIEARVRIKSVEIATTAKELISV
jgi:hypothetical protein